MSNKLQAYHVEYIHKDGGKRKALICCANIKELNKKVLKIQNDGGVIKKVTDVTFK